MEKFFIKSYLDEKKQVHQYLISDIGEGNVKELGKYFSEIKESKGNNRGSLTINQLRKFYDSFLKIYFTNLEPEVKKTQLLMLKANAEYSSNRLFIKRFSDIIDNRISVLIQLEGERFQESFNALKMHLEALVGYYPKEDKKGGGRNVS